MEEPKEIYLPITAQVAAPFASFKVSISVNGKTSKEFPNVTTDTNLRSVITVPV